MIDLNGQDSHNVLHEVDNNEGGGRKRERDRGLKMPKLTNFAASVPNVVWVHVVLHSLVV